MLSATGCGLAASVWLSSTGLSRSPGPDGHPVCWAHGSPFRPGSCNVPSCHRMRSSRRRWPSHSGLDAGRPRPCHRGGCRARPRARSRGRPSFARTAAVGSVGPERPHDNCIARLDEATSAARRSVTANRPQRESGPGQRRRWRAAPGLPARPLFRWRRSQFPAPPRGPRPRSFPGCRPAVVGSPRRDDRGFGACRSSGRRGQG
jgi:hypothetical protein